MLVGKLLGDTAGEVVGSHAVIEHEMAIPVTRIGRNLLAKREKIAALLDLRRGAVVRHDARTP